MSSATRDHIGPYRLLRMIRVGNTAQVWEAINPTDNQRFALKVLLKDHASDKVELAALKHEYNVGRQLNHPAVNRVHEFEIIRGVPYLVMDLFDGPNLKQMMRQSPETVAQHLDKIARQAAAGLAHLHSCGWVHRDVKPDNFLVNDQGDVKLIDFSIAQRLKTGLSKLFAGKPKVVQGTRSYMAPEQIRGLNVDARADIYSYGCTLFELITGRLPYTGTSPNDLLNKHLRAAIPAVSAFAQNVNPEFAKLVAQMMAKDPEQRPESMDEVLRILEGLRILTTATA